MWLLFNDCFLSIVHKDCGSDELLVRSRRKGDIERVFPKARVISGVGTDYLYRAVVSKAEVARAVSERLESIDYSNFKNSVVDKRLHDTYFAVWRDLYPLQK